VHRLHDLGIAWRSDDAAPQAPDDIGVFDYAPPSIVMPRAGVIVHLGGIGTTAQALRAGRPMLVVPFGQDPGGKVTLTVVVEF
jgi:UDP:flavonoid glycosyltransferase YjiC (YdhE family)